MSRRDDRVLDLDRSSGRGGRGHEQRGEVVYSDRDAARRCGGAATAEQGQAAATRSAATGTARETELGHDPQRPHGGSEGGQLAAHSAQLAAEALAGDAVAHVPARGGARTQAPVVRLNELLADEPARGVPRLGGLGQRDPGAHEQRLDGADRDTEARREIRVGHSRELAHEEG